jgi:hypothetical protein
MKMSIIAMMVSYSLAIPEQSIVCPPLPWTPIANSPPRPNFGLPANLIPALKASPILPPIPASYAVPTQGRAGRIG